MSLEEVNVASSEFWLVDVPDERRKRNDAPDFIPRSFRSCVCCPLTLPFTSLLPYADLAASSFALIYDLSTILATWLFERKAALPALSTRTMLLGGA